MRMNRRHLLLGLGALVAAPAVIRTPGLLMPVRGIPDRYVIRLGAWAVLRDRAFDGPWRVEFAGVGAQVINCTFNRLSSDATPVLRVLPGADYCRFTDNIIRHSDRPILSLAPVGDWLSVCAPSLTA